ncbi:hypothetical protein L596_023419 [Steinernema carpocapsae]|uniref:Uncharacterized protein n=1 Tax=Steinernema carpocapsae TaxID=34508 RepID=A0A4U5MDM5_STECR|nr:hypothetical protein L596_023419 [Steinernema carpocapsae]
MIYQLYKSKQDTLVHVRLRTLLDDEHLGAVEELDGDHRILLDFVDERVVELPSEAEDELGDDVPYDAEDDRVQLAALSFDGVEMVDEVPAFVDRGAVLPDPEIAVEVFEFVIGSRPAGNVSHAFANFHKTEERYCKAAMSVENRIFC